MQSSEAPAGDWRRRPRWHGSGKRDSVVSTGADSAWPVSQNGDGVLGRAPDGSRWHNLTAEMFRRHAEKFGPEMVKETAAALGIGLSPSTIREQKKAAPKYRRRTTASMVADAREMHARGVVLTAIADQLNVSDRRVKELLRG